MYSLAIRRTEWGGWWGKIWNGKDTVANWQTLSAKS